MSAEPYPRVVSPSPAEGAEGVVVVSSRRSVAMKYLAVGSLLLTVATPPVIGDLISAPFLFGLFLLALAGVPGGLRNRAVRVHNSSMNTRRLRNGS